MSEKLNLREAMKKAAEPETEPTAKEIEQLALDAAKEQYRRLKKILKGKPKAELIKLVVTYASDLREMQEIAKQLLEENKKLKGEE